MHDFHVFTSKVHHVRQRSDREHEVVIGLGLISLFYASLLLSAFYQPSFRFTAGGNQEAAGTSKDYQDYGPLGVGVWRRWTWEGEEGVVRGAGDQRTYREINGRRKRKWMLGKTNGGRVTRMRLRRQRGCIGRGSKGSKGKWQKIESLYGMSYAGKVFMKRMTWRREPDMFIWKKKSRYLKSNVEQKKTMPV